MSQTLDPETQSTRSLRSSTARNPRRRQRQSDGDSLKTAAPRRKRSKLSQETFASRTSVEGDDASVVLNGSANGIRHERDDTPATTTDLDLPVRGRKGVIKRTIRGDGSRALTQNNTYSVKLLPSTPRDLVRSGLEYRGSLGSSHHALAVTREKAYIWDHTAHTSVSHATEFAIPFATRPDEPLPFGALVTKVSSTEVGLLLVASVSGKVVFYESIERAASLELFQAGQTGSEGSLGALHSGEIVIDVVSSEHSNFIVLLSSGRVLRLTLHDAQGKPRISAQHLRPAESQTSGIFGSIKGFLGSMLHKGIVAARTRSLDSRGQMQVVALSEKANLQLWDLEWSGSYDARPNVDFRELIIEGLKTFESSLFQEYAETVVALDLAIVDQLTGRGNELSVAGAELPLDAWVLLRVGRADTVKYALAELLIAQEEVIVKRLQEIDTYLGTVDETPRLHLPKPGHTGYIVFEKAVVLFATTDISIDGPEAQLHASYQDLRPFEDTVYLRSDRTVTILSAATEDPKTGHGSCIVFAQGAGLIRFSAVNPVGDTERTRISAKDRLSQAVFFGGKEDNILDFSRRGDSPFAIEEVETAAISVSDEITGSTAAPFAKMPISIEEHLSAQAKALHTLVTYIMTNYSAVSKKTLWHLLWNAEKVAAGQELWRVFEGHKASTGKAKRTATVMDELCARAQRKYAWAKFPGSSGDELVHNIFVHGLQHLDDVLALTRNLLGDLRGDVAETPDKVVSIVNQADDIWRAVMYAVFLFRTDDGHLYGVTPEFLGDGILIESAMFEELPEFWSSTDAMLKAIIKVTQLSREFALEYFNKEEGATSVEMEERIAQISSANPRLIELICRMFRERIRWQASRPSARDRDVAVKLQQNFDDVRYDEFRELMALGQSEAAMGLAEKYRDMHTLTELVLMDSQYFMEYQQVVQNPEEQQVVTRHLDDLLSRTRKYFQRFGEDWANAFFDAAFSGSRAGLMLDDAQHNWEEALTMYLRAQPSRARICWINDVMAKKDFARAGRELVRAGREQETRLWAKKVELSLSKLALLAAQEEESSGETSDVPQIQVPTRELVIVGVQEQLYRHIYSEVLHCIDHEAAVAVATEKFVKRDPELLPNLRRLLEAGLERILRHQVLALGDLIDILTLTNRVSSRESEAREGNLRGAEFYLALSALDAAAPNLSQSKFETLLKLVWKRCYLYDDWVTINGKTGSKGHTDSDVRDLLPETAAWQTLYYLHSNAPLEFVSVMKPAECFGAGCQEDDYIDRFPDELVRPIVQDNRVQDEMLQNLVTDRRLEEWIERCDAGARTIADDEAEATAKHLASMRALQGEEVVDVHTNGHANGYVDGTGKI